MCNSVRGARWRPRMSSAPVAASRTTLVRLTSLGDRGGAMVLLGSEFETDVPFSGR